MKILPLGPNSTKFCTHNRWVTRRLEMQKMCAVGCRGPGVGVKCGKVRSVVWGECRGGIGLGRGGGPGGVAPWLARGPPKAALAASIRIKYGIHTQIWAHKVKFS